MPFVTVSIYSLYSFIAIYCLSPFIAKTTSIILLSKSAEMPVMSLFFYKGIPLYSHNSFYGIVLYCSKSPEKKMVFSHFFVAFF